MTLRRFVPVIVLALVLSVAAFVLGAGRDDRTLTLVSAAAFAALIVIVALSVNLPAWRDPKSSLDDAIGLFRRNTRLAALTYAWGAAAMLATYHLSGLTWRHGWQYGLGMALIAAGLVWYVRALGSAEKMPGPGITLMHGAVVLLALAHLVAGGTLATTKGDWAANQIFVAGGLALLLVCVAAGVSQVRLKRVMEAAR
jgi:hypothetical protein